jgi:hypothetical protein
MIGRCMLALAAAASIPASFAGKLQDPVAMFVLDNIPTNMSLVDKDMLKYTADASNLVLDPKYWELTMTGAGEVRGVVILPLWIGSTCR